MDALLAAALGNTVKSNLRSEIKFIFIKFAVLCNRYTVWYIYFL